MVTVKVHALVLPLPSVAVQVTVVTPTLKVDPLAGTQLDVTAVQLSLALTAQVTLLLEQKVASATPVMFAGQVMPGFSTSLTVTVKLQGAPTLPELSVTVHMTGVVPLAKVEPEAGVQTIAGLGSQRSLASGVKLTTALHWPRAFVVTMLAGQEVKAGALVSRTFTVKWQMLALPASSNAAQNTVVTPFGKTLPELGEQRMKILAGAEQLSVAEVANVTVRPFGPLHSTTRSVEQTITGS
jgi:hypothetical protein